LGEGETLPHRLKSKSSFSSGFSAFWEGIFTATYKYALLMALADLSVEFGDDSGAALEINSEQIAEKFIDYYWRQTLPFLGNATLQQNTGKPLIVIILLLQIRATYGDSIAAAKRDPTDWSKLVRRVADNIRSMPLRFLQNVGQRECLPFLYDPPPGKAGRTIQLYPDIAFCFRRFVG
jgi:hypothetical protein